MPDTYKTIAAPSEAIFKEKMSKFLAFAHPVTTTAEAKDIISQYQKKYFDARHVCWAYMVGAARTDFLSSDNGEPSGTAGKPILGQINSFGLTDIVIIVVRYFGGIKLGTSGLISAYREAARMAVNEAVIEERHVMDVIEFTFPYTAMNDVMKLTKIPGINLISRQFDNTCRMTVAIRLDDSESLKAKIENIDGTCFC